MRWPLGDSMRSSSRTGLEVGGDGFVEHRLLEDAGHDRADRASRVRGVPDLLGGAAVLVLDRAPSLLQTDEEGVDVCDVTLN